MKNKRFKKTLFNKNHINITNESYESGYPSYCEVNCKTTVSQNKHWWCDPYIVETKESPLGFYYTKKKKRAENYLENRLNEIVVYFSSGEKYNIVYYVTYNSNNIGIDKRPWEIADEKSMQEHFIYDLKNVIDSILERIKTEKRIKITNNSYSTDFIQLKNMIYTDLFGDKNGIRFQTDSEKIMSHGFDLKYSFRKEKEKQ